MRDLEQIIDSATLVYNSVCSIAEVRTSSHRRSSIPIPAEEEQ